MVCFIMPDGFSFDDILMYCGQNSGEIGDREGVGVVSCVLIRGNYNIDLYGLELEGVRDGVGNSLAALYGSHKEEESDPGKL